MRSPSYIKNKPPIKRRRYNLNRIKQAKTYEVKDICNLFALHKNTVLTWVKDGLTPLDKSRPMLIYGESLKAFLNEKQAKRKQHCRFNQLFCFKCQKPQEPMEKLADLHIITDKIARLKALCGVCLTPMNRNISLKDRAKFEKALVTQTLQGERLREPLSPSCNSDFKGVSHPC
jgi:hypothetical protein